MSADKIKISFTLNGKQVEAEIAPEMMLVDVLRDTFGLTGTKIGCGHGDCGACTVIMDGKSVASCIVLAAAAEGADILTIEGLADGDTLHPIQEAYLKVGAVQCGYCIPGMILSSKALLDEIPHPSREEIREALSGNLCRCTGYTKIFDAVEAAAEKL